MSGPRPAAAEVVFASVVVEKVVLELVEHQEQLPVESRAQFEPIDKALGAVGLGIVAIRPVVPPDRIGIDRRSRVIPPRVDVTTTGGATRLPSPLRPDLRDHAACRIELLPTPLGPYKTVS